MILHMGQISDAEQSPAEKKKKKKKTKQSFLYSVARTRAKLILTQDFYVKKGFCLDELLNGSWKTTAACNMSHIIQGKVF